MGTAALGKVIKSQGLHRLSAPVETRVIYEESVWTESDSCGGNVEPREVILQLPPQMAK